MKGNDGTGNNENRDDWRTNQNLWDKLNLQYHFTHDCCAKKDGSDSKCDVWTYDLLNEYSFWADDVCWMNPPFSKAYAMFEHYVKHVPRGVCIYRCDNMETKVWQDVILKHALWVFIPKGRVSYTPFDISMRGGQTRFPSALIGFNVEPPKNIDGTLLLVEAEKTTAKKGPKVRRGRLYG